jgi:hypothetical protein
MSARCRSDLFKRTFLASIALVILAGCEHTATVDEGIDKALAGAKREKVYPLAGKITIDGQVPTRARDRLVIMLNDPQKLDIPSREKTRTEANEQGEFSFTSYVKNDGIKAGTYVLTFAILSKEGKLGLVGPDKLNNLYNDPDKNSNIPEFKIDHQSPKTDYSFNLVTAGKEKQEAGPHALTTLVDPNMSAH